MEISSISCIFKIPAVCSLQIEGQRYQLGTYDDEADAARAFDRVARVLGRPRNFAKGDELEIIGPSSEGADQAVAEAVQAAKTFLATDKAKKAKKVTEIQPQKLRALHAFKTNNPATLTILKQMGSSEYKGVNPSRGKWRSDIKVSQGIENIRYLHTQCTCWLLLADRRKAVSPWYVRRRGRRSSGI